MFSKSIYFGEKFAIFAPDVYKRQGRPTTARQAAAQARGARSPTDVASSTDAPGASADVYKRQLLLTSE